MRQVSRHRLLVTLACLAAIASLPGSPDAARSTLNFHGFVPANGELAIYPKTGHASHFGEEAGFRITVWNGTRNAQVVSIEAFTPQGGKWPGFAGPAPFTLAPRSGQPFIVGIPHGQGQPSAARICARKMMTSSAPPCGLFTMRRVDGTLPAV